MQVSGNRFQVCPHCSARSIGEIDYCPFCQSPLQVAPQLRQAQACPYCRAPLRSGAHFCPRCGRTVAQTNLSSFKSCSRCGTQMPADKGFCDQCGNPL